MLFKIHSFVSGVFLLLYLTYVLLYVKFGACTFTWVEKCGRTFTYRVEYYLLLLFYLLILEYLLLGKYLQALYMTSEFVYFIND